MIFFQNIRLPFSKDEILRAGTENLLEHEKKVLYFLKLWYDDSPTVTVNTSGTTGKSKAITFRKQDFLESARRTLTFLDIREGEKALLSLSTDYIAGKLMVVRAIAGNLDLQVGDIASNPLKNLAADIDFAAFVPLQVNAIINEPDTLQRFKKIKTVIIGGGILDDGLSGKLKTFPNRIFHTFGMTETLTHVAMRKISGEQENIYRALPGISFQTDEKSRLIIHIPYLPAKEVITNDMVELIDEYSFRYTGRYDNIINSGGIKISPEKVEAKLKPYINKPFFLGKENDPVLGEKVVLYIESTTPLPGIEALVKKYLNPYERPKKIYYIDKFNRTDTGKIIRKDG